MENKSIAELVKMNDNDFMDFLESDGEVEFPDDETMKQFEEEICGNCSEKPAIQPKPWENLQTHLDPLVNSQE
jgi:hypothetical protein